MLIYDKKTKETIAFYLLKDIKIDFIITSQYFVQLMHICLFETLNITIQYF